MSAYGYGEKNGGFIELLHRIFHINPGQDAGLEEGWKFYVNSYVFIMCNWMLNRSMGISENLEFGKKTKKW